MRMRLMFVRTTLRILLKVIRESVSKKSTFRKCLRFFVLIKIRARVNVNSLSIYNELFCLAIYI